MWVFDTRSLKFIAVNEATIRNYGYSREELLTMSIKEIRPPEDVPKLMEAVTTRSESGLSRPSIWR